MGLFRGPLPQWAREKKKQPTIVKVIVKCDCEEPKMAAPAKPEYKGPRPRQSGRTAKKA